MSGSIRPPTVEDRRFMEALYERHKGIMYKVAGALGDPAEADDAVSTALLRLFRNLPVLRALNERQLVDYVATTVHAVVVDRERRRRTERRLFVDADSDGFGAEEIAPEDMEEELAERERRAARLGYLREALDELSASDRLLLVGRYIDGESEERLAARLGVRPASVRMKLSRARKRARKVIERKEAGHETRKNQR